MHGGIVETGYAPRYAPGLMEQVAERRGIPPVACMVSRIDDEIGSWVVVVGQKTGTALACRVVDISHPRDAARHRKTRRIVEIGHEVAMQLCGSTRSRPTDCPVKVFSM